MRARMILPLAFVCALSVWAELSAWCAAASGDEPLKPGSPQASQWNAEQLAVAAAGVKQIVAHRGSSVDRPENTLASTLRANEAGATTVEVDVRTTRDGQLVLSHDATLDRTTDGTGRIGEKTLEEIRRLDAGSWFDKRYAAERMPSKLRCFKRFQVSGELSYSRSSSVAAAEASTVMIAPNEKAPVGVE